jgi:hypothetical protein
MLTSLPTPKPFNFSLIGDVFHPFIRMANLIKQDLRPFAIQPPDDHYLDEIVWKFYHRVVVDASTDGVHYPPVYRYPPIYRTPAMSSKNYMAQRKECFDYYYHSFRNTVDDILNEEFSDIPDDDDVRNRIVAYMSDFMFEIYHELERQILHYIEYHIRNEDSTPAFVLDPDSLFYRFYETYHLHQSRPNDLPVSGEEEGDMVNETAFHYAVRNLDLQIYQRWSFSLLCQGQLTLHFPSEVENE